MTIIAPATEQLTQQEMIEEINQLRRERNAVLLAHNYEYGEIQDIADYVGDSLGLSQVAASTEAEVIVFCGVHFMAETASILSPEKTVLIPDPTAGCSLADSITVEQLREWKQQHPEAVVVSYVNTTAAVKAESDYCVTSGNALKVVQSIPEDKKILFLPDMFLGSYVRQMTGRDIEIWAGECHVHAAIRPEEVTRKRAEHPDSDLLIHPECGCVTPHLHALGRGRIAEENTFVLSTEAMIRHAEQSKANTFVVATEIGVLHRMQKACPTKRFVPISESTSCRYMKQITLEKILHSLRTLTYEVKVPQEIADRARLPIERMLAIV